MITSHKFLSRFDEINIEQLFEIGYARSKIRPNRILSKMLSYKRCEEVFL